MKRDPISEPDQDMAQSAVALRRAARRPRNEAERTRTPLVTYENGAIKIEMVVTEEKGQRPK